MQLPGKRVRLSPFEVMLTGLKIKTLTSLVQRSGQPAWGNVMMLIMC